MFHFPALIHYTKELKTVFKGKGICIFKLSKQLIKIKFVALASLKVKNGPF